MTSRSTPILKFHGVRGSRPTHEINRLGYGGNTTCIEVDTGHDFFLLVDAGSGLQRLQQSCALSPNRKRIHLLITHTHWDHILFLPLLPQLGDPDFEIFIYAPDVGPHKFETLFNVLTKKGRIPIPWSGVKCKLKFQRVRPNDSFLIEGKVKISAFQVNHQHVTLSYKLGLPDKSLVIMTDTAKLNANNILGHGMKEQVQLIGEKAFISDYNASIINFLRGVDYLIFDTHFNEQNLRMNWGHGTPELALELASASGIKKLFLFHHAPEDDDNVVARKQDHTRHHPIAIQHEIDVINAREGDEWRILSA